MLNATTKKLKARKKPREFWILLRNGVALSTNWGCYDSDSVYDTEPDTDPEKGDILLRVREVGGVKVTKVDLKAQQDKINTD